jgi:hypothetical protein
MGTMNKARLKKILTDPPRRPGQRCRVCSAPAIQSVLAEWVASRTAGGRTSLMAFHERYLRAEFEECPSFGSVRGHVIRCLRLDPVTARSRR